MSKPLIDDELWNIIESLLPRTKRRRKKNLRRSQGVSDRAPLTGIMFVLRSGIPSQMHIVFAGRNAVRVTPVPAREDVPEVLAGIGRIRSPKPGGGSVLCLFP